MRNLLNQMSASLATAFGAAVLLRAACDAVAASPAGRSRRPVSTTPSTLSTRWSAWWTLIA